MLYFFDPAKIVFYKKIIFSLIFLAAVVEIFILVKIKIKINLKECKITFLGFVSLIVVSFFNSSLFANFNLYLFVKKISLYLPYNFTINSIWWVYGLLVYEFFYWLQHFLAHKVRILWCFHSIHHAPTEMNLFVGFNHSFVESLIIRPIFVGILPVLLGVNPVIILVCNIIDTSWGCFLHVSNHTLSRKLGVLEYFMQTPLHHRAHHSKESKYIDTNFASITLFWDYILGTYKSNEQDIKEFGITRFVNTQSFWDVQFGELYSLWKDIISAPTLKIKILYIFKKPGWNHNIKTSY